MQGGLKKRRNMLLRKQEGAVEAVILCSVLLLYLVGITVYSLQLRVAKNEKYMVDNAVIAAATSTLVTDLYQYATTEENVLDCTGDAYSNGLYDQPLEATKEACKVAYGRFLESLSAALGLDSSLTPVSAENYLKSVSVKEFTVYNVVEEGIYSCTYTSSGYQDGFFHGSDVTISAKGMNMKVLLTSVYVDLTFTVEVFGKQYEIPVQEYVYSYHWE